MPMCKKSYRVKMDRAAVSFPVPNEPCRLVSLEAAGRGPHRDLGFERQNRHK